MNFFGCVKHTGHDDKMHFPAQVMHFHAMHAIKFRHEGIGIFHGKFIIVGQDTPEEFRLGLRLGLDHKASVVAVEEKLATLAIRNKFNVIKVPTQRQHIVGTVDAKAATNLTKNIRRVVFKLERVLEFAIIRRKRALVHAHKVIHAQA